MKFGKVIVTLQKMAQNLIFGRPPLVYKLPQKVGHSDLCPAA